MRLFIGMIVGCVLTIVVAYLHDASFDTASTGGPAATSRQIVNWDAAASEWALAKHNMRVAWDKLRSDVEKMRS